MSLTIDYFFAPNSPWTYLGHLRFWDIARAAGAAIRVLPVDLGGKVFPVSGGLKRFSEWRHAPLNLQPKYFPVAADAAARLIIAVDMQHGTHAAMHIADAVLRAVWVEDRNIADEATLAALLAERELPARCLADSHSQAVHERYEADTEAAIAAGVFGAPSYVVDGEIFWGQDRLDFLERRLRG